MDSDTIIRELERRANELESESQRLRAAVDVLRGHSSVTPTQTNAVAVPAINAQRHPRTRGGGSMQLIVATLNELGPMHNLDLTQALQERGWQTTSTSPSNTVRTALGRLMEREEVVRLDDGRFATMAYIESNAPDE